MVNYLATWKDRFDSSIIDFFPSLGMDEVGRGALAGPLVVGAVYFDKDYMIDGLKDSKLLKDQERRELCDIIKRKASYWSIGWAYHWEIDKLNIYSALVLACKRAILNMNFLPEAIFFDGSLKLKTFPFKHIVFPKADRLVPSVAAASIIAKVARDDYMINISKYYPDYLFDIHKGYGTKFHLEVLEKKGLSKIHRKTFCRFLDKQRLCFE
ncbi:Ribonuclease H [Thermodesulfobium narugense DSM 14796]|uniref:Ribonuclease n=1 Tax=Thermodesulfobium narugense DSM 14796 TaxID=747365 RepID=M1E628_9BACT|nr:Ribonuclease H [Thermodesulfobium narugense DSM 14796]